MNTYVVSIPLSAYVLVEVEAENEKDAIDRAFEEATLEDVEEWELHKHIVEGNVFYGLRNNIEVDEV